MDVEMINLEENMKNERRVEENHGSSSNKCKENIVEVIRNNDIQMETEESASSQMVAHLICNDKVIFKSQQRDEAELTNSEKSQIAHALLHKSKAQFLQRFGKFLLPGDLIYFKTCGKDDDEINLIIKDIEQFHSTVGSLKSIKNRRYKKLKELIDENSYFSENEMMKRNPLLYEQLIGKYLSDEEKKERDKISRQDSTFVKILMEGK